METLPIINLVYEIYKDVTELNYRLEKRWRYSLGQSLEQTILDLLGQVIMTKNAPKALKVPYLIKASSQLEISVLKLRLVLELKLANETKVFQIQSKTAEAGRMIGGWLKSVNSCWTFTGGKRRIVGIVVVGIVPVQVRLLIVAVPVRVRHIVGRRFNSIMVVDQLWSQP